MSTFNNITLFEPGRVSTTPHGRSLRSRQYQHPNQHGAALIALGQNAQPITQNGLLIADDPAQLEAAAHNVESLLDGKPHDLVDEHGRRWANTVMHQVVRGPISRIGPRSIMPCRIEYIQVNP